MSASPPPNQRVMNNPVLNFITAIGLSILINILLFALLPRFVTTEIAVNDLDLIMPVLLAKIKPEPPPKPQRPQPPEKKPQPIPQAPLRHKPPAIPKPQIEVPKLDFDINPKLTVGMTVSPPKTTGYYFDQTEVDRMPFPLVKINPFYPYRARRLNITGAVEIRFVVDAGGTVGNIEILDAEPPGVFEESVIKAVSSWKFSPGTIADEAVATIVTTTIHFKLEN